MMATGDAMGELIVIKDLDSQGTKQPLIKKKTEVTAYNTTGILEIFFPVIR